MKRVNTNVIALKTLKKELLVIQLYIWYKDLVQSCNQTFISLNIFYFTLFKVLNCFPLELKLLSSFIYSKSFIKVTYIL